ncbi:MAG: hypothetical protein JF630_17560 [Geodermatophilales bacterium]|nr:hypothetical protein [Geodermatophilales bacterium]
MALGAGHTLGVTVAGAALLAVVAREAGPPALRGLLRAGSAALLAAVLAGATGVLVSRALGADPVPRSGVVMAVAVGVLAGVAVLVVASAVIMGTAGVPLAEALRELHSTGRQEVHGG